MHRTVLNKWPGIFPWWSRVAWLKRVGDKIFSHLYDNYSFHYFASNDGKLIGLQERVQQLLPFSLKSGINLAICTILLLLFDVQIALQTLAARRASKSKT